MILTAVALSVYLLFPIFNERHEKFALMLNKNPSSPEQINMKLKLLSKLKDPSEKETFFSETEKVDDLAENKNEKSLTSVYWRNSKNMLSAFSYDDEVFVPVQLLDGERSFISVNQDKICRVKFDKEMKICEEIEWTKGNSVSDSKMIARRRWNYGEKKSITEELFDQKKIIETFYDEKNNPVKIYNYLLVQNPKSTSLEPLPDLKKIDGIIENFYDGENRLIESNINDYERKIADNRIVYKKKILYIYTSKSSMPDMKVYEDDKLRLVTEYENDETYYETIYFDEKFSVRSKYVDDVMVEENVQK